MGVALVVAATISGCSSATRPNSADGVPTTQVIRHTDTTGLPIPIPSSGTNGATPAAIVAATRGQLTLDDAEASCLQKRLSTDPKLVSALGAAAVPGTTPFNQLASVATSCQQAVTFAPQFAASVDQQTGGKLTAAQQQCLTAGFAKISPSQMQAVITAGLHSKKSSSYGQKVLQDLFKSCGVAPPKQ